MVAIRSENIGWSGPGMWGSGVCRKALEIYAALFRFEHLCFCVTPREWGHAENLERQSRAGVGDTGISPQ